MPRTKVTSTSKDAITDDGNVLISYIDGEQLELSFTAGWLMDLDGVQIRCQVLEAVNDASGTRPTQVQTNGVRRTLEIRNSDGTAVSGFTYDTVEGLSNAVVNMHQDEANSAGRVIELHNVTIDITHEYLKPGDVFRFRNSSNVLSGDVTIQRNLGLNPDSGICLVQVDSVGSIPLSTDELTPTFFPTHHQLTATGNQFRVVLPEDLLRYNSSIPHPVAGNAANTRSWTQQPTPGNAVYGFIGLEIREAVTTGQVQQIWRPMRGQVEILYSVLSNTI